MSSLALCALLVASNVSELPVSEREPMALVLRAPALTGDERAETIEHLRARLEDFSRYRVEDVSGLLEDADDPLRAIVRASASGRRKVPELTLAVSLFPAEPGLAAQVSWQLLRSRDAQAALSKALDDHLALPSLPEFVVAFELFEWAGASERPGLILRLLQGLEPAFEKLGAWRPHGTLRVKLPTEGFVLRVDGKAFEASNSELQLDHAETGTRTVALEHPDYESLKETLHIARDQTTLWRPALVDKRLGEARVPRTVVFVSGLGLVAAGAALLAVAAAQSASAGPRCLHVGEPPCATETSAFTRLGPVPTAPLGYSLALTGGVMAGGVLLSDATTLPWWWTALGVGLGVASFAISVLAEGGGSL